MANNKRIQVLRGTNETIEAHKDDVLLKGQPLYNLDTKLLRVGDGESTIEENTGIGAQSLVDVAGDQYLEMLDSGLDCNTSLDMNNNRINGVSSLTTDEVNTETLYVGKWELDASNETSILFKYRG